MEHVISTGEVVLHQRGAVQGIHDRVGYLVEACRGRRVLHCGCTDAPMTASRLANGTLLHGRLLEVARECVGIDLDAEGLEVLRRAFPGAPFQRVDVTRAEGWPDLGRFDVVVAGELLEHLDRPVDALAVLAGVLAPGGVVIVTVPNAFSLKGALRALVDLEVVHRDHVAYFSPRTLEALAERAGLRVERLSGYVLSSPRPWMRALTAPLRAAVRAVPLLCEGLIAELSPAGSPSGGADEGYTSE